MQTWWNSSTLSIKGWIKLPTHCRFFGHGRRCDSGHLCWSLAGSRIGGCCANRAEEASKICVQDWTSNNQLWQCSLSHLEWWRQYTRRSRQHKQWTFTSQLHMIIFYAFACFPLLHHLLYFLHRTFTSMAALKKLADYGWSLANWNIVDLNMSSI